MDKRFSWIFLAASAAFFVFIVGLTGYRIETVRRVNSLAASERIGGLAGRAAGLRNAAGSFDAPLFRQEMRRLFDAEARLLLLAIHSPSDGMLYLVARNRSYVRETPRGQVDPPAEPSYQYSRGYEALVRSPLPQGPSGEGAADATVDGLFVIMGREDLYPILRDDLYLFLAFLLVCGVFILIVTGIQQDDTDWRNRPAAAAMDAGERPVAPPAGGPALAGHLKGRLQAEIERAASGDQDISFAVLHLDTRAAGGGGSAARAAVLTLLQESFSRDLIFDTGGDSFAVVIPDADVDQAVRSLEAVRRRAVEAPIGARACTVSAGASSRAGRLVEEKTLREEALIALEKAAREGGNRVVGFRADPARFRRTLAG